MHEEATKAVFAILASPRVEVIFIDESLFVESINIYKNYKGKLSFTDSTTVTILKKYGIKEIFSHDKDFDKIPGIIRKEKTK